MDSLHDEISYVKSLRPRRQTASTTHPRGAIGLPLRINKTSDMAKMSSPTGQTIRASSSAKNEISGARIGFGRSAMKSAK
jgi:hypothetical protein